MRFIKQYPHISTLLIFSIVLFFIGVYVAVIKYAIEAGARYAPPRTSSRSATTVLAPPPVNTSDQPPAIVIKEVGKARATYYSRTLTTETRTEYLPLRKIGSSGEFTMSAFFEVRGYTIAVPDKISFHISVKSKDDKYTTNRAFKIFLDGVPVFEGNSKLGHSEKVKGVITASLLQEIPYYLFALMARSKVLLQIGDAYVELTKSDVQSFRDLVKLVELPETNNIVMDEATN